MKYLIQVLQASADKNGSDKTLTIGHFLNIALLAQKLEADEESRLFDLDNEAYNEAMLSTLDF